MAKDVSWRTLKLYWSVYLFVLPSALLVGIFSYFPAASAFYHAFYRWNGENINYFVGDLNFKQALGNYGLWGALYLGFMVTLILGTRRNTFVNVLKLFGGIILPIAAVAVLAKLGLVLSETGFNFHSLIVSIVLYGGALLCSRVMMSGENDRRWVTTLFFSVFLIATALGSCGMDSIFAWMTTLLVTGVFLNFVPKLREKPYAETVRTFHIFAVYAVALWGMARYGGGDPVIWNGFAVIVVLVLFNIVKMIPSILTAVVINRLTSEKMSYLYKVCFVIPMIVPGMVTLLLWKFFFDANIGLFNQFLLKIGALDLLVKLDGLLGWGGVFKEGVMPVWLGNEHLVLPAIILWGFPWIGVVGVLIYLAGLEGISASVYEAADLDGAGPVKKFLHIELPLILTQVRINMVLMIIGTLQMYGFILILFGDEGGPNGKLLVPGLFMFTNAFKYGNAGYACAIGLILFAFILLLTELNNRYIRVEK